MYNVLLTSAGRRVELIKLFKKAAQKLSINSTLIAADSSDLAPALYFADKKYVVPRILSPDYIDAIIEICTKEQVALVVPTIDTELMLLSENKNRIEAITGAKVLVSESKIIEICRDKVKSQAFFEDNGFSVPKLFSDLEIRQGIAEFPLFIKPLDGSSSINAHKVNTPEELWFYKSVITKPMVQEFVVGQEYSVDVFLDFCSNVISIVPRLRLSTRSGEILKGRIIKDQMIMEEIKKLMAALKPIGHITIQCIKAEREIQFIEINPRFGGGAPMSIMAGADSCENLYRLLRGEALSYSEDFKENIVFLRYDSCVELDENKVIYHD